MKTLLEEITGKFEAFAQDANAQAEKNNKAAGQRARKLSLELEKAMKEFRKKSVGYNI